MPTAFCGRYVGGETRRGSHPRSGPVYRLCSRLLPTYRAGRAPRGMSQRPCGRTFFRTHRAGARPAGTGPVQQARRSTISPRFVRFAACNGQGVCPASVGQIGTASTVLKRARRSDKQRGKSMVRQWTNSEARRRTNSGQTAGFNVGQTARRGAGQTAERRARQTANHRPATTQQNDGTNSEAVRQDKQHHEPPNINGGTRQTPTSTARQRPKQTAGQTASWRFANDLVGGLRSPRFSRGTGTTHALHLRCVLPWPLRGPFALPRKALMVFAQRAPGNAPPPCWARVRR